MYKIIGFLSRPHGFSVLNELIDNPNYDVIKIFTHKLKPKTEDPEKGIRDDYHLFSKLCNKHNIELTSIDSKNDTIDILDCDVIVEVSWRFLISSDIVKKAKILAFGIHRGKLPDYPKSSMHDIQPDLYCLQELYKIYNEEDETGSNNKSN